jgi:catabolite regulation protein CreA
MTIQITGCTRINKTDKIKYFPVTSAALVVSGFLYNEVFSKGRSMLFKKLHVVRFLDRKRNVLVYLAFTDKLVEGSPKHSISSVPIMPWATGR